MAYYFCLRGRECYLFMFGYCETFFHCLLPVFVGCKTYAGHHCFSENFWMCPHGYNHIAWWFNLIIKKLPLHKYYIRCIVAIKYRNKLTCLIAHQSRCFNSPIVKRKKILCLEIANANKSWLTLSWNCMISSQNFHSIS